MGPLPSEGWELKALWLDFTTDPRRAPLDCASTDPVRLKDVVEHAALLRVFYTEGIGHSWLGLRLRDGRYAVVNIYVRHSATYSGGNFEYVRVILTVALDPAMLCAAPFETESPAVLEPRRLGELRRALKDWLDGLEDEDIE